jgi:thiol-disulfide isomerase/thioredoxin
MWIAVLSLLAASVLVSAGCTNQSTPQSQLGTTVTAPSTASKPQKKVEFLVFGAKWCAPCRGVPPVLDELREKYPNYSFRYLDVDDKDNMTLSVEYGADALPYNFIVSDGKVVGKFKGFLPFENATGFIEETVRKME